MVAIINPHDANILSTEEIDCIRYSNPVFAVEITRYSGLVCDLQADSGLDVFTVASEQIDAPISLDQSANVSIQKSIQRDVDLKTEYSEEIAVEFSALLPAEA